MTVALFIPCYVDQFYQDAAIATLQLLEKYVDKVVFPPNQTCCGQPMANAGFEYLTQGCNNLFIENFAGFDYIVCPSASCVLHVKLHLHSHENEAEATNIRSRVYELVEFLTDVLKIDTLAASFPYKVGLHQSCHGLRGLYLSQMSEVVQPPFSKPEHLLNMVKGLELITLDRLDECCGFGGTFSVAEEAVSVKMGKDRVTDHTKHGAEYITSSDLSCLMHIEGILHRKKSPIKIIHIAEILNATL
ncbi:MAG: (Fe-S)-binding protein [Chitinophagaceae bacterium]